MPPKGTGKKQLATEQSKTPIPQQQRNKAVGLDVPAQLTPKPVVKTAQAPQKPLLKKREADEQESEASDAEKAPPSKKRGGQTKKGAQPASVQARSTAQDTQQGKAIDLTDCDKELPVKSEYGDRQTKEMSKDRLSRVTQIFDLSEDEPTPEPPILEQRPIVVEPRPVVGKAVLKPTGNKFPRLDDGEVYIELKHISSAASYRLHASVLADHSSWFHEQLCMPREDSKNAEAADKVTDRLKIAYRFELFIDPNPGVDIEVLQRVDLTRWKYAVSRKALPQNNNNAAKENILDLQRKPGTANENPAVAHPPNGDCTSLVKIHSATAPADRSRTSTPKSNRRQNTAFPPLSGSNSPKEKNSASAPIVILEEPPNPVLSNVATAEIEQSPTATEVEATAHPLFAPQIVQSSTIIANEPQKEQDPEPTLHDISASVKAQTQEAKLDIPEQPPKENVPSTSTFPTADEIEPSDMAVDNRDQVLGADNEIDTLQQDETIDRPLQFQEPPVIPESVQTVQETEFSDMLNGDPAPAISNKDDQTLLTVTQEPADETAIDILATTNGHTAKPDRKMDHIDAAISTKLNTQDELSLEMLREVVAQSVTEMDITRANMSQGDNHQALGPEAEPSPILDHTAFPRPEKVGGGMEAAIPIVTGIVMKSEMEVEAADNAAQTQDNSNAESISPAVDGALTETTQVANLADSSMEATVNSHESLGPAINGTATEVTDSLMLLIPETSDQMSIVMEEMTELEKIDGDIMAVDAVESSQNEEPAADVNMTENVRAEHDISEHMDLSVEEKPEVDNSIGDSMNIDVAPFTDTNKPAAEVDVTDSSSMKDDSPGTLNHMPHIDTRSEAAKTDPAGGKAELYKPDGDNMSVDAAPGIKIKKPEPEVETTESLSVIHGSPAKLGHTADVEITDEAMDIGTVVRNLSKPIGDETRGDIGSGANASEQKEIRIIEDYATVPKPVALQNVESAKPSTKPETKIQSLELVPRKEGYSLEEQSGSVRLANPKQDILDAYSNLFLIFYSEPPTINTTDVDVAFPQLELLAKLARVYGSIEHVLPSIQSALFGFNGELPMAIFKDPPRWMKFSIHIESAWIYQTAMLHLAGIYPVWPVTSLLKDGDLVTYWVKLIEKAQLKTLELKSEIDQKLFGNSLSATSFVTDEKADVIAVLVASLWRDWLSQTMKKPSSVLKLDGTLYRLLAKGGVAYLPLGAVMAELKARGIAIVSETDILRVDVCLTTLKKQAQGLVAPLCVNNSRLSVEELGIKYLTCVCVDDIDLPWHAMADYTQ